MEARAEEALDQAFQHERRPDEAVRGADELHHLYLLAAGEDRDADGVGDQEHARYEEQDGRRVEAPDHVRGYRVQPLDGLLRVAEVLLAETFGLELARHLVRQIRVGELDLQRGRQHAPVQVLVELGLLLEGVLEGHERLFLGDPVDARDFFPAVRLLLQGHDLLLAPARHEDLHAHVLAHGAYDPLDVGAYEQPNPENEDADERSGDGGDAHEQVEADVLERLGQEEPRVKPHQRRLPSPCRARCGPLRGRRPACASRPPSPDRGWRRRPWCRCG